MYKTKRYSEKPWFSKLTSEKINLELRTQLNFSRITGRVHNHSAKQLNDNLTMFKAKKVENSEQKLKWPN